MLASLPRHAPPGRAPLARLAFLVAKLCCALAIWGGSASGDETSSPEETPQAALSLAAAVRQEILDGLGGEYVDDDDWGKTTEAFKGFKIEGKGLKLRIRKRTKPVRHGLWEKYQVKLIDPHQHLHLRVTDVHMAGPGKIGFRVLLSAELHGEARVERWRQGIKLLNFSAEANSKVETRLDCELAIKVRPGKYFNQLVAEPRVTGVQLKLQDLDVQKISKLGGWAAHEVGDSFKGLIDRELRRREAKIVTRLNKSLDKRKDKFRLSPEELLALGWSQAEAALGLDESPATASPGK